MASAAAPESDRSGVLLEEMRNLAAGVLGHASGEGVEPDVDFLELGLSSLTAVEMRNHLSELTGLDLPVDVMYEYPTLASPADRVAAGLGDALEAASAG